MEQRILSADETYSELDMYLKSRIEKTALLVCDNSFPLLKIHTYFETIEERLDIKIMKFNDFMSNPSYDSVEKGVDYFHEYGCEMIIAVGGGSAIDVAKCIKLYSGMEPGRCYLEQEIIPNEIELLAVPTTAGTGSEATRYAVIYYKGEKQSVTDDSCMPQTVLLDSSALKTLPDYQRKATMMDAMCHAIESFWSVNSTEKSKKYSKAAIQKILTYCDSYLDNEEKGNFNMLYAANMAGKAINITQTTAGHAMSYKLTSLYGIAHGHAAALCISKIWPYTISHIEDACADKRGEEYLVRMFEELADIMGCKDICEAVEVFLNILQKLDLQIPVPQERDFDILANSVNEIRLKNHPIRLNGSDIDLLYRQILAK